MEKLTPLVGKPLEDCSSSSILMPSGYAVADVENVVDELVLSLPPKRILGIVSHCIGFIEYDEFELFVEYGSCRCEIQDFPANYPDTSVV